MGGIRAWHSIARDSVLVGDARGKNACAPRSFSAATSDFRLWLGLLFVVWMYLGAYSIVLLIQRDRLADVVENDIVPFRMALERWVLPRRLTPEQIESIGAYLSRNRPYAVSFKIARHDEEASGYRCDVQAAIERGGWSVTHIDYADDLRTGLTTNFTQTMASSQSRDDHRNPKPDRLLSEALRMAGVQIDGGGGGSGVDVTEDMLMVQIGPRRRDTCGHVQKYWPTQIS